MIDPSSFILHPSAFLFATAIGAGFDPKFWWVIGAWIALMGAFFGSFMNVVVYRLPTGKRLAYPGSACPFCGHSVRWFDNVPVLSWLLLRARCRDCKRPIAGRYPLVEALVGAMFLWLVMAEVYSGGATLPVREISPRGMSTAEFETTLWLGYAFRLLLMCTLLCAALIQYDGRCPPLKLYWPAMLVGVLLPVWKPAVRPIAAWANEAGTSAAAMDGVLGLAIGFAAGMLLAVGAKNLNAALAAPLNLALIGVFLGWQAAIFIAAATAGVCIAKDVLAAPLRFLRRLPDSAILVALTFIFLLNWGKLAESLPMLGPQANLPAAAFVLALAIAAGVLRVVLRLRSSAR